MDKIPFKAIEKYWYGLRNTVSKHLKSVRGDEWQEKNGKEKQEFEKEHNVLWEIWLHGNAE